MIKKSVLFFLCFMLFLSIPGCKKKLPTQPDIPTKILPSIEYFTATPESISSGESSILSWSVSNATNVTIDQGVGTVSAKATTEVNPEETTTYTLTATNSDGQKTQACTVEVCEPPLLLPIIEFFSASHTTIEPGQQVVLSWLVTNATQVSITYEGSALNDPLSLPNAGLEGEYTIYPAWAATYSLIAQNDYTIENDCPVTATATVTVIAYPNVELASYWTSNEPATIWGYVKNTGNAPVCRVYIKFTDNGYGRCETEISGWIMPGEKADFGAERIPFAWTWTPYQLNMPPEITWCSISCIEDWE